MHPLAPEAKYRTGECWLRKGDFAKAITELLPFRDQGPLQNVPNVSDRAVLRLGNAYALAKQWDASRQTLETMVSRYPQSPWRHEARYGIAWAWQNQGQYDNAVNTYTVVTKETGSEVAARAQIQSGLCRLAQKRPAEALSALLIVPLTYDYNESSAMALCEAGRVYVEQQQPRQAVKLYERVKKDYATTPWSKIAEERLQELEKAQPVTMAE
jgi:TolA-binding protein